MKPRVSLKHFLSYSTETFFCSSLVQTPLDLISLAFLITLLPFTVFQVEKLSGKKVVKFDFVSNSFSAPFPIFPLRLKVGMKRILSLF